MAIRMIQITAHSRSRGHTAAAAIAYRHGLDLTCVRTGEVYEYGARRAAGHIAGEGLAGATPAISTPADLAVEIERSERRRNSQLLRDVQVALPVELGEEAREELTVKMARALSARYRTPVAWAVHRPHRGDTRNHHAHLILPTRTVDADDPAGRLGKKLRELCERPAGPREIRAIRETWVHVANEALARAGIGARLEEEQSRVRDGQNEAAATPEEASVVMHPDDRLPALSRDEVAVERREAAAAGVDPEGVAVRELLRRVELPHTRAGQILAMRLQRQRLARERPQTVLIPIPARSSLSRVARARAVAEPPRARGPQRGPGSAACPVAEPGRAHSPGGARLRRAAVHVHTVKPARSEPIVQSWRARPVDAPRLATASPGGAAQRLAGLVARLAVAGAGIQRQMREAHAQLAGQVARLAAANPATDVDSEPEPRAGPEERRRRDVAAPARYRLWSAPSDAAEPVWRDTGADGVIAAGDAEALVLAIGRLWAAGEQVAIAPERQDIHYVVLCGSLAGAEALERDGYSPWATFASGEEERVVVVAMERRAGENEVDALGGWGRAMEARYGLVPVPGYPAPDGVGVRGLTSEGVVCMRATAELAELGRWFAGSWEQLASSEPVPD